MNLKLADNILKELDILDYMLAPDGTYVLETRQGNEVHGTLPENENDYQDHLELQLAIRRSGAW